MPNIIFNIPIYFTGITTKLTATASVAQSLERWCRDPGSRVQFPAGGLSSCIFRNWSRLLTMSVNTFISTSLHKTALHQNTPQTTTLYYTPHRHGCSPQASHPTKLQHTTNHTILYCTVLYDTPQNDTPQNWTTPNYTTKPTVQ